MNKPIVEDLNVEAPHDPPLLVRPADGVHTATVLWLHWFDEAPNANRTQFVEEASGLATNHGIVSILPQLGFPWKEGPVGLPRDLERINLETESLSETLVYARSEGLVDDRLGLVGHDFGAMHGTLLMARESFRCGVLIAPTPRWSDWFLPFWDIPDDRYQYMQGLDGVDPINAVRSINTPVLFQFGKNDFFIAPMTGSEIFQAANEPKNLIAYESDHAMDDSQIRQDREGFLLENLGLGQ